jgi:hypothetical protein
LRKVLFVLALFVASMSFPIGAQAQSPSPKPKTPFSARLKAEVAGGIATGINFTFNYVPNAPPCAGTTANCQSGFALSDTTLGQVVANNISPTALAYTYTPAGGMYFGTHTFSLVATGYNSAGGTITSAAATTSVTNGVTTLNGPTGLTGTPQ